MARPGKQFIREIQKLGVEVREGTRHLLLYVDERLVATSPRSFSDHGTAQRNVIAQLRRAGIDWRRKR